MAQASRVEWRSFKEVLRFWTGNGGSSTTKILGLLLKVFSYDPPLLAFQPFIKWGARILWARVYMKFDCQH
jgi:hypothetical protein